MFRKFWEQKLALNVDKSKNRGIANTGMTYYLVRSVNPSHTSLFP